MRTGLFVLLFSILASVVVLSQTKDEEKERQRIAENNIKKITQWTHRFSQGKPNESGFKTTETHYDKNGNPIEIINYRASGEISSRLLYKYNNQNQRIEYVMYQRVNKPELEVSYKQNFHYNPKGLKTVEIVFDGATGYRITYDYYPDDQLKEIIKYGVGNKIDEKWAYTYGENTMEIKIFGPENNLTNITRRTFDANGNMLEDIRLDANDKELRRVSYAYDSKGNVIEKAEFFGGNLIKKLIYKYNSQNQLDEIVQQNPDGTKFTQSKYSYDSNGNLLEERWSEGDADEFSHKQSRFDDDGNVVETDSYFAPYRYRVLYKYTYEYY